MFKCCVCRKASKKEKSGSGKSPQQDGKGDDSALPEEQIDGQQQMVDVKESKQQDCRKQNGSAIESPKSLGKIHRPDEKHEDAEEKKDKPNGDVQMRQEIILTNVTQKDEIPTTPKGDQMVTNDTKNDGETLTNSSLKAEGQNNSFFDEGFTSGWNEPPRDPIFNGPLPILKNNLYDASAYIVRTIDDGPDDEGDDSVFESCPAEVEDDKKPPAVSAVPRWLSQEEDDDDDATVAEDGDNASEIHGGMQEPPATPVARDELALRRHRFFSDLLSATQNSSEHRVRFDPLGPLVHAGCEVSDREDHLEELVTRLENVTKRLEKVPDQAIVQTQEIAVQTSTPSPKRSAQSSEKNVTAQQAVAPSSSQGEVVREASTSMSVAGYEDILAGSFKDYLQLSEKIGGDVAAHSKLVELAFQNQLQFLKIAASSPAPANQSMQMSLLAPTSAQIEKIQEFREQHRGSAFFNHLSAISESIPALGWVAIAPTPAPYVKEMNDAGQFYTNRVLKEWKEKDKTHVEWCKAWVQTLSNLQQYVRQHHTTGLVWAKTGSAVPPPPPPCGVPPPPPSMPLADMAPSVNDDRSALFAQINQGEAITKSLKKVTSDMQTHKNPSLRTGPAPFKAQSNSVLHKTVPPANAPIDKPPVFAKDGKKWLVEYQQGKKNLVIDDVEMNNVVYMFRCQDSTLTVKGKLNSIVMDSCRKSSIVFDSLVSSISFVNCQSVQMQVLGHVPTISIDKTDGCQMYMSKESLNAEIISSKSSEMNAMLPKGDGDYAEHAIPEQFKTTITGKGLSTVAVDVMG